MALLSIIVPTYNEAGNVGRLVGRISTALAGCDHELVFVDDSTDGTDRILADLAEGVPRLRVVRRGGRGGLASAVIDGIAAARGDVLCVLDADLQHPPEALPALLRAIEDTGADLAIGSRYVQDGRSDFTVIRQVISWGAIACARILLRRAHGVSDPVSGFFAFRRRVVDGVELRPLGYKILLEILVRGHLSRVVEVPYHFEARSAGQSKLTVSQTWAYLRHLVRLWKEQPHTPPLERVIYRKAPSVISDRAAAKRREFVRYLQEGPVPLVRIVDGVGRSASPRVSVIIPVADESRSPTLERLLQQLRDQRFQEFEAILVQGDRRQGRAINAGAAIARGDVLVTMDDDTQLGDAGVLDALVGALDRDHMIGIAGVPSLIPQDAPPIVRRALREIPRRSSPPVHVVTDSDMAEHPCLAIRKELFYRVGGEHEQIPRGLDPYLRREVRRLGYRVVVIPGASIHHLLPPTLGGILRQYFRNGRGAAYVRKFYPEFVIEQATTHNEAVSAETSLAGRAGRYGLHLAGALAGGRWIYLGTLIAYALGYAWGLATLRRDSL